MAMHIKTCHYHNMRLKTQYYYGINVVWGSKHSNFTATVRSISMMHIKKRGFTIV